MAHSRSGVPHGESVEMNETNSLKGLGEVEEDFGFGDDLELNQFDGLPYSSRYYKLLKERHQLPIWESRQEFLTVLEINQLVIISGTTKTGKSTQVCWILNYISHVKSNFFFYTGVVHFFTRLSKLVEKLKGARVTSIHIHAASHVAAEKCIQ